MTVILLTILATTSAIAVPSRPEYIAVDGVVEDMWLDEHQCWFSIEIEWSNHSEIIGKEIDCMVLYLNESTGKYDLIRSSQGWQIGDRLNCTAAHQWDERSEGYFIYVTSRDDLNYAREQGHGIGLPLLLVAIIAFLTLSIILTILVRSRKRH